MMNMNDKGQLRKLALSKRNGLSPEYRLKAGQLIAGRLLALPLLEKAELVMCYRSFRSEVPTGEIVEKLSARGKKLCFPLCKSGGIMEAYMPLDENSWKKGSMGIMEPDPERSVLIKPEQIDLVLCPMVAFDGEKGRMGYGGGYYDRYLPRCPQALRIGLAFQTQQMAELAQDEFDQRMNIIITEEEIY